MIKKPLNRIIITGDAGRGKSTLASKLSKKLGIRNYSTDDFYYIEKFSVLRDRPESIEQISKIYLDEKWIVEGTTEYLLEAGLDSADLIIHLKHKTILGQWIIMVRRYFHRDNETILGLIKLMRHVLYKKYGLGYRKGKRTPSMLIAPHTHKVITLSSFKEIDHFTKTLD